MGISRYTISSTSSALKINLTSEAQVSVSRARRYVSSTLGTTRGGTSVLRVSVVRM
ncbi:hypothetical protein SERLA73DRAFT_174661 [Serpula lacrymans var. lacrymans S7.3]|uniref:Uncharacterized protein n=2 Tax=Serpula lacrymans var. lacrymans TaxID=341189 RepID=F8PJ33_SERL3|nr:uncharacterized protein SERLADRAFT_456285 [Serpula lacrymans var. lacrymans S7.9]EGO03194.1 hypothetical protein SERLA73DRAFT_174661 [Serpula lacrymans var. lacrymans S7.3]EGO28972.1 hypothetical protein SERLADRAFT_456285 [Serpula lacrymans var. lacrymans S7.9]